MNFGLAFSYIFQEEDWIKKVLIAAVLLIIPIIGWIIVAGWAIEITRRVIRNETPLLPEWSDFSKFIIDGLFVLLIGFIYSLPSSILSGIIQGANIGIQNMQGGEGDSTVSIILAVVSVCVGCFAFIYGIAIGIGLPAVYTNFAMKGGFGSAFQFKEIFAMIKAAPGAFVIAFLGQFVAGIISIFGIIACIIGVFATMAYSTTVMAHFWGQAYNVAQEKLSGETSVVQTM